MRQQDKKGVTIVELLVAVTLFGLFLTVITALFIRGYDSYSKGTNKAFFFRQAAKSMDVITSELRQAQRIYKPDEASLPGGYLPVKDSNSPLIFVKRNPQTGENNTIAYTMDNSAHTIERFIYGPSFNPDDENSWNINGPIQTQTSYVQTLKFIYSTDGGTKFIQVNFTSYPDGAYFPLRSKVEIKGGN